MFYLQLYYEDGTIKRQESRSLVYAKREADLMRVEAQDTLIKIEIYGSNENETDAHIIEAFYIK